jgi:hypothetical protein
MTHAGGRDEAIQLPRVSGKAKLLYGLHAVRLLRILNRDELKKRGCERLEKEHAKANEAGRVEDLVTLFTSMV